MPKKVRNVVVWLLLAVLAASTFACSAKKPASETLATQAPTPAKEETKTAAPAPTEEPPAELTIEQRIALMGSATYTSEIPDWTGKQMKLQVWEGHGTGDATRVVSTNDVVSPEIQRITGISLDASRSFDNGGMDFPSKLAVLAATNDLPDIGYNVKYLDLISEDKIYDLTDLIPVYAPHIYERIQSLGPVTYSHGFENSGRIYNLPCSYWPQNPEELNTLASLAGVTLDPLRTSRVYGLGDTMDWTSVFYIRDDILKLIYPNAKSQDEIEAMYIANGAFTREQVYDVPIKSKDDFFDFLYELKRVIDENKINENGRPVYPTYVNMGGDNWWVCSFLIGQLNGLAAWNYFTYFDLATKHIETGFKQDFFIEDFRRCARLVRDGVAPESCLIDDNEVFQNKLNNGEYALTYGRIVPNAEILSAAGKPYRYRKMYIDIPQALNRNVVTRGENPGSMDVAIFKDSVAEEDVPQILMWLDCLMTNAAMDLMTWGPESAGLWEYDGQGGRRFLDKDLEDCLVYGKVNGMNEKYNLACDIPGADHCLNFPCIYPGVRTGYFYGPKYQYNNYQDRQADLANDKFSTGIFQVIHKSKLPISNAANIWMFFNAVPDMQRFWDVRGTGFEPMMTKCLAARNDAEFDAAYDAMVKFAADNGYTDESVAACEAFFKETYPDDWAGYLAGY